MANVGKFPQFKDEFLLRVFKICVRNLASTPLGKRIMLIEARVSLLSEVEVSTIEMFASTPLGQLILLIQVEVRIKSS